MMCKASAPSPLAGEGAAERPEGGRADTSGACVFARPPPPAPAPPRDRKAIPLALVSPAAERPVGGGGSENGAHQCA